MSKLFFEMTETEAQLQNILNSLEYAQYQMSTGINGYGNGTMTREEHQETERSVLSSLGVAMSGVQKLIGEYASLEEAELLPEMATEEIMQINAESVDQYEAIQKAFRLGMEKAKSENVVEHPVYGSEDMEEFPRFPGLWSCNLPDQSKRTVSSVRIGVSTILSRPAAVFPISWEKLTAENSAFHTTVENDC